MQIAVRLQLKPIDIQDFTAMPEAKPPVIVHIEQQIPTKILAV